MAVSSRTPLALMCLALGWAAVASAQDTPAPPAPETPGAALPDEPVVPEEAPSTFRVGWTWGLADLSEAVTDVAVHPIDPQFVAAVNADGAVWLSQDGAGTWGEVLSAVRGSFGADSSSEAVLFTIDNRLDEIRSETTLDDLEFDPEDFEDEASYVEAVEEAAAAAAAQLEAVVSATQEATDQVRAELAEAGILEQGQVSIRSRVWFTPEGGLFAARSDGLYYAASPDESWSLVLEMPVLALARLGGQWTAGTPDGLRVAADPTTWLDPEDGTEGLVVFDLAETAEGSYAATDQGLWFAGGWQPWSLVGSLRERVSAVLPDPDAEGLWVVTPRGILYTEDSGAHFREGAEPPLQGVTSLVHVGPGHLVCTGEAGPQESIDGGATWAPLALGLAASAVALAVLDETLVVATTEGVHRLQPADQVRTPTEVLASPADQDWIDIDALMGSVLGRPELDARVGSRWVALMVPQLVVDAQLDTYDRLTYVAGLGSSRDVDPNDFRVHVQLVWKGNSAGERSESTVVSMDSGAAVVGSDVSPATLGPSLGRAATGYRSKVAGDVSKMYFRRGKLVAQRARMQSKDLMARVEHELKIRELEATLDALTNGGVSSWRAAR